MKTVNYLIILFLSCWFILKSIKTDSQICQKGGVFRLFDRSRRSRIVRLSVQSSAGSHIYSLMVSLDRSLME